MVCERFCDREKTELVFMDYCVDTPAYFEMIKEELEPFGFAIYYRCFGYQQENAPAHSAKLTKDYFWSLEWKVWTGPRGL